MDVDTMTDKRFRDGYNYAKLTDKAHLSLTDVLSHIVNQASFEFLDGYRKYMLEV